MSANPITPVRLAPSGTTWSTGMVALTTSAASLRDAVENKFVQILGFKVCNHTAGAVTFSLHIVPSGGTAVDANLLYSEESVAANDTLAPLLTGIIIPKDATIQALASANTSLNILMWGTVLDGDPFV